MDNLAIINSPEVKSVIDKYSPFLKEIRKRIILTVSIFAASTLIGFVFYEQIIKFLIAPLSLEGVNIVFTSPFQFINLAISCGISVGLIVVFPLILYQILSFLRPALSRKEFKTMTRLIPFCLILFVVGFVFGAVVMRWQIQLFIDRSIAIGIGNVLDISKLLSTVLMTSVFMGLGFQFPIILLLLIHLGVVNSDALKKQRMWIYVGSFVFAILLPVDSILADILLALPLIILFEVTLLLNRNWKKK